MIPETQFIIIEKFKERLEILEEAMIELIDHYFTVIPTRIEALNEGIKNKDLQLIATTAHSIKNDISQFDADIIYKNAIKLEEAARLDDLDSVKIQYGRFSLYHTELNDELIAIRKWLITIY